MSNTISVPPNTITWKNKKIKMFRRKKSPKSILHSSREDMQLVTLKNNVIPPL
jgi:hypothetical protein